MESRMTSRPLVRHSVMNRAAYSDGMAHRVWPRFTGSRKLLEQSLECRGEESPGRLVGGLQGRRDIELRLEERGRACPGRTFPTAIVST